MKLWQLVSISRDEPDLIADTARADGRWAKYAEATRNFERAVQAQDRAMLGEVVEPGFVRAVLSRIGRHLFLSNDGQLRVRRTASEQEISLVEAAERFGGDAVEDAMEFGSVKVRS